MQRRTRVQGGVTPAVRRPLKIFASDPLLGRTFGNRAVIEVANEALRPGPVGTRVEVVDYDGARDRFYEAVDLDDPGILMQGGVEPSESDPRFHQQMVYAVATRTIENFDRALGRPMRLAGVGGRRAVTYARLRLLPHAFYGANAFYSRELNAILFGYFLADAEDPGPNLPGQTVFTCLSHDIVVHETTHALVDRLRPLFLEPTNPDVLAFHEAFADLVALLQHFSYADVLRQHIQQTRSDIRTETPLVQLARQFGYATGTGKALRSALDAPGTKLREDLLEPHDRGSVLVAAVFGGYFKAYRTRIHDLIRIATGGTGQLPSGDLHPDLVNRIAQEASRTAQRVLDMCVRAFDYLPPVDVEFGDFLRALVTADYELVPADPDLRDAMIEAFRERGIYPDGVPSLAEESLLWPAPDGLPPVGDETVGMLRDVFFAGIQSFETDGRPAPGVDEPPRQARDGVDDEYRLDLNEEFATSLQRYGQTNAAALGLDPAAKVQVRGFHPVFRVAPNGRLLIELVAQFAQQDASLEAELGGVPFRGGATLIAASNGSVRYLVPKPFDRRPGHPSRAGAEARLARQRGFVATVDMTNRKTPYMSSREYANRIAAMASFRSLHGG
jgi:hypothetical protein